MNIEQHRWEPAQPLTKAYLADFATVAPLYEHDPWDDASETDRVRWLDSPERPQADRNKLADVLEAYNRAIGNAPAALAAIESLRHPRSLAVVGGQQAGLFTGPLLAVYKAITIIQEARRAAERLQRPVAPVFWIAGEDHDYEEVNHIHYLSDQLAISKIKCPAVSPGRVPISHLPIPPEAWEDVLARLDRSLADSEFKADLLRRIGELCRSSVTLTEQFAKMMASLFGEFGLVLVDSADPALRRLETEPFRAIIASQRGLNDDHLTAKARIETMGFAPQAEVYEDQANLFVCHNGERLLLHRAGDRFTDRKQTVSFTESELLALAEMAPERLSNNVMTRPLMQEYLFPVLAAVLGPAEIAYWGLLKSSFRRLGMRMPILVPRLEFTLVEGTLQKLMNRYGLTFEDAVFRFDEKRKQWLDAQGSLALAERFADVKAKFADLYGPLVEAVATINPGMRKLGETNMQKIFEQIAFLETRAADAFQSQFDSALRHWERIRLSLLPLGKPQERVYNVLMYLNKYGDGWLKRLTDTPLERNGMHRIVYF